MSVTNEARVARQLNKMLDSVTLDPDMVAYSFTQGTVGADTEIQKRMYEVMIALNRVWAGWHVSGYAGGSKLEKICENAHKTLQALDIENVWENM